MGLSERKTESAQRKLMRGIEHVKALCAETAAFEGDGAYIFQVERKSLSAEEYEYRCYAIEQKPMPDHWPLLAGEAIQNLRSALDHFVYAASGENSCSQFPIFTDPRKFQVHCLRRLKGVPESTWASIERAQPYRHMPDNPHEHPLELLRELSNLDKHRVLATFASAVVREGVGIPRGVDLRWEKFGSERCIGPGKTHISTFVVTAGETDDVQVEPMFSYEVRIEGRPISVLRWIAQAVSTTLSEIDPGMKPSPSAQSPI